MSFILLTFERCLWFFCEVAHIEFPYLNEAVSGNPFSEAYSQTNW